MLVTQVGTRLRISIEIRDLRGELVDPDSVAITARRPDGRNLAIEAERTDTGLYAGELTPTISGEWTVVGDGKGSYEVASSEEKFIVDQRSVRRP